ncbi:MAG: FapA family protein [Candidatus Margulisbacteria bacterium]|nr:FapA family protein [Candidatus Margulisiibacteriota bacterium]
MPKKVKSLTYKNTEINIWETGNISFLTTETLEPSGVEEFLLDNSINFSSNLKDFIYTMNQQISGKIKQHFIFVIEHIPNSFIEYLSNNALIRVYKDEMKVEISLSPEAGFDDIMKDLKELGIVYGIQTDLIKLQINRQSTDFFIAALGQNSCTPKPRLYEYNYLTERPIPINVKQKDKISFLDFTVENIVSKNTELVSFSDSVPGINGLTITGLIIPAKNLSDSDVMMGENVYEKNNKFYSSIDGMVIFDDKLVSVTPTLIINKPVLRKQIEFNGTIIIRSKVTNSSIKASKDIIIHGDVIDSNISNLGFMYFLSGITGKQSKASAYYDVFCPYVHSGAITSTKGNIYIPYEAFNARIKATGSIVIERKISGGSAESSTCIKVHTAGGEKMSTKTILRLYTQDEDAMEYEAKTQLLREMENQLRNLKYNKKKHELQNIHLKSKIKTDPIYIKMTKMEFQLQDRIQKMKNAITSLKRILKEKRNIILIFGTIWGGVQININDKELTIKDDENYPSIFSLGNFGILRKKYA